MNSVEEEIVTKLFAEMGIDTADVRKSPGLEGLGGLPLGIIAIRRWAVKTQLQKQSSIVGDKGRAELNRSIVRWLETCRYYRVPPPELIAAVSQQLNVSRAARDETRLRKQHEIAVTACALDPGLSNKKLARGCGVSEPTIARWKKNPTFEWQRRFFENLFATMTKEEKNIAVKEIGSSWLQKLSR